MLSKRYLGISDLTRKAFRSLGLLVGVLVLALAGCASFEHLTTVTEEFPRAKDCGKCHVEIFHEWAASDHATAYTNPHYRGMTDNYEFADCLSCHAPEPMASDRPPTARSMGRIEGVTCVSCHLEQGKLSGPMEPTGKVAPHPIGVRPEFYGGSVICGRCHEGTFVEWQSVADQDKKSCQHCHMSPVKRTVTQATGWVSNVIVGFEKEVAQKRHDLAILAAGLEEQPVSFGIQRSGKDVVLVVKNNLPHALPTGDFGYRVLLMEVFAVGVQGNMVSLGQREFAKELGNAFAPGGAAKWLLGLPTETTKIHIQIRRQGYEDEQVLDLMDVELPLFGHRLR